MDWDEKNRRVWERTDRLIDELGWIVERRVTWRRINMPKQLYRFISGLTVEICEPDKSWKVYCHLSPGAISQSELEDIGEIAVAQRGRLREQWNVNETRYPLDPLGPATS